MTRPTLERIPTTPGEVLSEEFLKPMCITQKEFADHLNVDIKVINRLINNKTTLSAEMALKIAASLETSAEFWLSLQYEVDLFNAKTKLTNTPQSLLKKKTNN